MSKRSYHVRSEKALIDLEINEGEPVNGISSIAVDFFVKVLDEDILGGSEELTAHFLAYFNPTPNINEYVPISTDSRFNPTSKTFFAQYTGNIGVNTDGQIPGLAFRFGIDYVVRMDASNPQRDLIECAGEIQPYV